MRLSDKLRERDTVVAMPAPRPASSIAAEEAAAAKAVAADASTTVDAISVLKARAQEALFARLGSRLYDSSLSEAQLHAYVVQELGNVIEAEKVPLTAEERRRVIAAVTDDVLGFGPIEQFLADNAVTEILVDSDHPIYVERGGRLHVTESRFLSQDHLRQVIDRIVAMVGRRIDESSPMVDARLADGSRVNAIIPPLAIDGPALTIRKFSKHALDVDDLVGLGTLTPPMWDFFDACVRGRLNVLVSGGTGTGKTTLLNVLSSLIPGDERIVTIEDAAELQLKQTLLVRLETRPPNIEGRGQVTARDLVRNALRMRPDRIIVGEVRSGEALDMLQAMNTGHDGSLSTLHANSPRDALARLETMVLMAGIELPVRAIREQVASAIDLIVHMTRLRDGSRRVTQVCEVNGMEGETIMLSDLFVFDFSAGIDEDGRFRGSVAPTGLRPQFGDKLQDYGIEFPAELFGEVPIDLTANGRRRS
jgi:pilus assembly protein CpaF